jgi:hypothetical protein
VHGAWTTTLRRIFNADDALPLTKWAVAQRGKWAKDGSSLKEKYPTEDALEAMLKVTSNHTRNSFGSHK